jgi:hypothetical protein
MGRRFISGNPIGNDVTQAIADLVKADLANLPTPIEGEPAFELFFKVVQH